MSSRLHPALVAIAASACAPGEPEAPEPAPSAPDPTPQLVHELASPAGFDPGDLDEVLTASTSPDRDAGQNAGQDTESRREKARADCPLRPGPSTSGPLPAWRGLSAVALERCFGAPSTRSEKRWTYRWPRGCSDRRTIVVAHLQRGAVRDARADTRQTGEHCLPPVDR